MTLTPTSARADLLRRELLVHRAHESLKTYMRLVWSAFEPGRELLWNWHLDAYCEHLEAWLRGEIRRMVFTVPPGSSKTSFGSLGAPTWWWLDHPETRFIFGSYDLPLVRKQNQQRRDLVASSRYRDLRPRWRLERGSLAKQYFANLQKGWMLATSVGAGVTGNHADYAIIDDPMRPADAHARDAREAVVTWWDGTLSSRFRDKRDPQWLVIMQRLAIGDLADELIGRGDCEHLLIPTEYDPRRSKVTVIDWRDPRRRPGQLLDPRRDPPKAVAKRKRRKDVFAAQDQQHPLSETGNIVSPQWFRRWTELPAGGRLVGTWDLTVGSGRDQDYAVGQIWYVLPPDAYVVHQVRAPMDLTETLFVFGALAAVWPSVDVWLVEKRANGKAVINVMRRRVRGVLEVHPEGETGDRVHACAPWIQSGNVHIPGPGAKRPAGWSRLDVPEYLDSLSLRGDEVERVRQLVLQATRWAPDDWVDTFLAEFAAAPGGAYNDCVDAAVQLLLWLRTDLGRGFAGAAPAPPAAAPADDNAVVPAAGYSTTSWRSRFGGH